MDMLSHDSSVEEEEVVVVVAKNLANEAAGEELDHCMALEEEMEYLP